jgi:hypothetical protein
MPVDKEKEKTLARGQKMEMREDRRTASQPEVISATAPEKIAAELYAALGLDALCHVDDEAALIARIVEAFQEVLQETCICAAIRLESGEVFRGHRHDDAIRTAGKCDDVTREYISNAEQGFITSAHRFVSREEGARLQRAAGIPSAHTKALPSGMLFSEDLYLRSTNGMPLAANKDKPCP